MASINFKNQTDSHGPVFENNGSTREKTEPQTGPESQKVKKSRTVRIQIFCELGPTRDSKLFSVRSVILKTRSVDFWFGQSSI